jgi:hypothetical protein
MTQEEEEYLDYCENLWEGIDVLGERVKEAKKFYYIS